MEGNDWIFWSERDDAFLIFRTLFRAFCCSYRYIEVELFEIRFTALHVTLQIRWIDVLLKEQGKANP